MQDRNSEFWLFLTIPSLHLTILKFFPQNFEFTSRNSFFFFATELKNINSNCNFISYNSDFSYQNDEFTVYIAILFFSEFLEKRSKLWKNNLQLPFLFLWQKLAFTQKSHANEVCFYLRLRKESRRPSKDILYAFPYKTTLYNTSIRL